MKNTNNKDEDNKNTSAIFRRCVCVSSGILFARKINEDFLFKIVFIVCCESKKKKPTHKNRLMNKIQILDDDKATAEEEEKKSYFFSMHFQP